MNHWKILNQQSSYRNKKRAGGIVSEPELCNGGGGAVSGRLEPEPQTPEAREFGGKAQNFCNFFLQN